MIFFRVDSNNIISGGHVMRCIALAKAFQKVGERTMFLIADDNSLPVLEENGFDYLILHSDWQDLMSDAQQTAGIVKKENNPILFIDTYSIVEKYVNYLKPYCKIVYLGSKLEYIGSVDYLINYSTDIDYDFYSNNYTNETTLLLGASYAPLREEFQNLNVINKSDVKDVLITTGNTDPQNFVPYILKTLANIDAGVNFHVVVGRMFKNVDELKHNFVNRENIVLHENVKSMSSLMKKCDLAITANGTTVYELAAVGLPIISFAMVAEQKKSAEALGKLKVIEYCGQLYDNFENCVSRIIDRYVYYVGNNEERLLLAQSAHRLIDGNGCQKIVHIICK